MGEGQRTRPSPNSTLNINQYCIVVAVVLFVLVSTFFFVMNVFVKEQESPDQQNNSDQGKSSIGCAPGRPVGKEKNVSFEWEYDPTLPPLKLCSNPFPEYYDTSYDPTQISKNPNKAKLAPRCVPPIPDGYVYPPNWPERKTAPVRWDNLAPNFSKQLIRCTEETHNTWCGYLEPEYLTEWGQRFDMDLLPIFYKPLKSGRIRTILDVGGGAGEFAHYAYDFGAITLTVNGQLVKLHRNKSEDIFIPFQELISERGFLHLTMDLLAYPYPFASRSFDMIFSKYFLSFIFHDKLWPEMFMEWTRIVRPGGFVVIILHDTFPSDTTKKHAKSVWWKLVAEFDGREKILVFVTPTSTVIPT